MEESSSKKHKSYEAANTINSFFNKTQSKKSELEKDLTKTTYHYLDPLVMVNLDSAYGSSLSNFSDSAVAFNGCIRGDGGDQRINKQIYAKSIYLKYSIDVPSRSETPLTDRVAVFYIYLYLVLDTQCNGTSSSFGDIFDNNSLFKSQELILNKRQPGRFKILRIIKEPIELFDLSIDWSNGNWAYGARRINNKFFLELNFPVNFMDNGGSYTSILDNYLSFWGYHTSTVENLEINPVCRISFHSTFQFIG